MKNVKHGLLAILVLVITPVALAKVEIENRSTQNVEELGVEQIAKSMELGNKLIVEDVENGVAISGNVDLLPALKGGIPTAVLQPLRWVRVADCFTTQFT